LQVLEAQFQLTLSLLQYSELRSLRTKKSRDALPASSPSQMRQRSETTSSSSGHAGPSPEVDSESESDGEESKVGGAESSAAAPRFLASVLTRSTMAHKPIRYHARDGVLRKYKLDAKKKPKSGFSEKHFFLFSGEFDRWRQRLTGVRLSDVLIYSRVDKKQEKYRLHNVVAVDRMIVVPEVEGHPCAFKIVTAHVSSEVRFSKGEDFYLYCNTQQSKTQHTS
jgi:hypothetical protein